MSRRNREKRAAKQKNRRRAAAERERTRFAPRGDRALPQELLVSALHDAAMCPEHDAQSHATELLDEFPTATVDFEMAAEAVMVGAIRAMLAAGRRVSGCGQTRTRSFRQSFLVAYATRIGERLDTANATVTAGVKDARLLPVLAAHSRAADELVDRLFPSMVHRPVAASNPAGWGAGRAAADLASLDVHAAIAGQRRGAAAPGLLSSLDLLSVTGRGRVTRDASSDSAGMPDDDVVRADDDALGPPIDLLQDRDEPDQGLADLGDSLVDGVRKQREQNALRHLSSGRH